MGERNGRQVGFSAALALRPATGIFRHSFGSSAGFNPHPKGFFVKGFVPTPASMVDVMVAKLFAERAPSSDTSVLDPGCGDGEFIEGILRACAANGWAVPRIVGVELDPNRAAAAKRRFTPYPHVEIRHADFLHPADERFDFIGTGARSSNDWRQLDGLGPRANHDEHS